MTGCACVLATVPLTAAESRVVINEIFYAPADKTKLTEFVELYNPGEKPVDMGGWHLDGVKFTLPRDSIIPPKGFVCIVQDPKAFKVAFGVAGLGPWDGKLKNGGERLQLIDAGGALVDAVDYKVGHPWPTKARGGGAALELINARLDRTNAGSWRAGGPSPGKQNSVAADNAPPAIAKVKHSPKQPKSGESVRITAEVADPDGVRSVTLAYQVVEPGAYIRLKDPAYDKQWAELPMRDDGEDGDEQSGDGLFTAKLPAEAIGHRRLIRYRVLAQDAGGLKNRAPAEGEPVPNFALFVYDGIPPWTGASEPGRSEPITFTSPFLNTLPTFHLIAQEKDVERSQWDGSYNHRECVGTLVFDGRVFDHVTFQNRGRASTYNTGKNKWGISLPKGYELQMQNPTGQALQKKWDGFAMNACASPWVGVHRGMAGLDEWISARIYELAGVPTPRHIPIHFRVIDNAQEAPAKNQYGGDLWGLYLAIEDPDGSFLDERALDDGNIYTNESGKKEHQAAGQAKDRSDLDEFMNGSRSEKAEAWWTKNLNLPAYYGFRAASHITGNVDLREGANHYLYNSSTGWFPIPWDLDMMLLPRTHQSGRIDQERVLENERFRIEYRNRCRELLDLLLADATPTGGQVGQLLAQYDRMMTPAGEKMSWPELDRAMWNHHPRTGDKGGFYRTPARDDRFGGSWDRKLKSPDFAGMSNYVLEYLTNARPADKPWKLNDGDPRGYGYGYLQSDARDDLAPARPTLTYTGAPGFPANALKFKCSAFSDPQGAGTFASLQVRFGRIAAPGVKGWSPDDPWQYEIEEVWTSPEVQEVPENVLIPAAVPWTGSTYRARVRMKDATGRWSRWSEPVEFVAGPAAK